MNGNKKNRKLSAELLIILIPMIAAFIIIVAVIILTRSRSVIIEEANRQLFNESEANASDIGRTIASIKNFYDGVVDSIATADYTDDADFVRAHEFALTKFDETPTGVYFALSDKTYLDPSGWVPDEGYDPTTRDWYIVGNGRAEMTMGEAYLDMDTNTMIVSMSRGFSLRDGRSGVASIDIYLNEVSENVAAYTPGQTGEAVLFEGKTILAAANTDYNGQDGSTVDNKFINDLAAKSASSTTGLLTMNNGSKVYCVSFNPVPGTDWTMVSYVPEDDVLAQLNKLINITVVLVIAMLIVSTVVIGLLIKRKVTTPVSKLTDNILHIADGDFTIDIETKENNEIGVMNGKMKDYVAKMRATLTQMKDVTKKLTGEAENSRASSTALNTQARDQSESMSNIHQAMEGVSKSVTELATNATELAQAVGEMTDQGTTANATMETLLEKAKQGQKDMENVQTNMGNISSSMKEMSDVVHTVDEAAQKINSIVEMINAISSQTNLLSLNASIEAARAGEAGKGFAVVATEIGNLANESANATTEISQIINDITTLIKQLSAKSDASAEEISLSSEAVSVTEQTFTEIFRSLNETGDLVQSMIQKMDTVNEIATSVAAISEEQAASTEEVTATVDTAAASAKNVATESMEVDQSAETVADSASKIDEFVDMFKV
ncbi:MAG: HAMP domain-containing protein [Lachnospiraceae bacterium]|nr:HAMP domain-containing protein [Lachnospiraceae bacterium]